MLIRKNILVLQEDFRLTTFDKRKLKFLQTLWTESNPYYERKFLTVIRSISKKLSSHLNITIHF
ncbi:hypothetical protein SRCM100623_02537 [Acetobacter pasteurianus]|uniref:Uncharacterized protein n=1 Tax=Acetobacter pasteurianus TaxID=438 RepID=A0A1A0CK42_ACEPA|nr:hypothetical protein SRCM100623_02537 [Acetobacter pasteurianus]GCD51037.1 hypothetical protein NBRC106471_2593 [Acetobacter pasteurianus subsp. pasteurianus LMG 1262 = NBRC 106471]